VREAPRPGPAQRGSNTAGAIARSGLGRVVYALSNEQHDALDPAAGWAVVPQEGPALFEEARTPIENYNRPR
jgi:hypothetical protein